MKSILQVLLGVLLVVSVGCDVINNRANFQVSVSNRLSNTLTIYANGVDIGEVGPGRAEAFILKLRTADSSYTGPTATAYVTFAGRDVVTGKLSREKRVTLTEDRPRNVEFNTSDF
jgi:hypothetical protein